MNSLKFHKRTPLLVVIVVFFLLYGWSQSYLLCCRTGGQTVIEDEGKQCCKCCSSPLTHSQKINISALSIVKHKSISDHATCVCNPISNNSGRYFISSQNTFSYLHIPLVAITMLLKDILAEPFLLHPPPIINYAINLLSTVFLLI